MMSLQSIKNLRWSRSHKKRLRRNYAKVECWLSMWRLLKYIRKIAKVARQRMKQSTNIIKGIMKKSTKLAISEIVITYRIWRLIECVPEYDTTHFREVNWGLWLCMELLPFFYLIKVTLNHKNIFKTFAIRWPD